jgi:hypothetical protein
VTYASPNGIALNPADLQILPTATKNQALSVVGPNGAPIAEPNPIVGNIRNRLDLLNLTVGATFVFRNQTTLATAFAFPLNSGDNRTFDWEFQLQLNYYFGGFRNQRGPTAPTF